MIKKIKENINFVIHIIALVLTVLVILTGLIAVCLILLPLFLIGTVVIAYKKILISVGRIGNIYRKHL